jgi:hypothetical protein
MKVYLAIIITALVVIQVIRLLQNVVQLHRQKILFNELLGDLANCNPTEQDFETQRKAYRLIIEHFEAQKIKPPMIREETRNIVNVRAEAEIDELIESHDPGALGRKLMMSLVENLRQYATVQITKDPLNYCVRGKAVVSVLDKPSKEEA